MNSKHHWRQPRVKHALARVQEVAPTDASVMLLGETGTGKELFARAVHNRSTRRHRPFVNVNCAALPSTLIETELFGHVRGLLPAPSRCVRGASNWPTAERSSSTRLATFQRMQAKLLRVLQEGQFERLSQSRKVDVRIVAATHHDLEAAMKEGRFRADLLPAQRVSHRAAVAARAARRSAAARVVASSIAVSARSTASSRTFPTPFFASRRSGRGRERSELANVIERAMIHHRQHVGARRCRRCAAIRPAREAGTLEEMERHVEDALRRCRWRINGRGNAAEVLGLHPNTLRNRMKKFGIQRPKGPVPFNPGRLRREAWDGIITRREVRSPSAGEVSFLRIFPTMMRHTTC